MIALGTMLTTLTLAKPRRLLQFTMKLLNLPAEATDFLRRIDIASLWVVAYWLWVNFCNPQPISRITNLPSDSNLTDYVVAEKTDDSSQSKLPFSCAHVVVNLFAASTDNPDPPPNLTSISNS